MQNKLKVVSSALCLLMLSVTVSLYAQYVIEQMEYELAVNYDLLPENVEFQNQQDEAKFFVNLPASKLKQAASDAGNEPDIQKSTLYIDNNKLAIEMASPDGKISIVTADKSGAMYYVVWSQKKVYEFRPEDMQQIQKDVDATVDEMLNKLSPEMRAQMLAEMKKSPANKNGRPQATATGKTMVKNGFNCEQYLVETDDAVIAIWATADVYGLAADVSRVTANMDRLFGSDDEQNIDEWELVPGKIPVMMTSYHIGMMSEPFLNIQEITKIEKRKPSPDKFKVPGANDGFTRGSIKEMMMQMTPEDNEF